MAKVRKIHTSITYGRFKPKSILHRQIRGLKWVKAAHSWLVYSIVPNKETTENAQVWFGSDQKQEAEEKYRELVV